MSEIQRLPATVDGNPVHPNAKTTTHVNNGTTTTKTNISSPVCRNCKTQTTPLWRRDETGQVLCNACGLFLKLHGRPRPISLKTDTIKSRNRIKQQPNSANSTKATAPNTPELKSKDSKPSTTGKTSPKMKKKSSEMLTPMFNKTGPHTTAQFTSPTNSFVLPAHHAHISQHAQPLHYPASTPTHFAPGLQRITSPLLLSTTSSISNTRNSASSRLNNPVHAAAGALENMSNELGPSATFKSSKISTPMSLINNKPTSIKKESAPVFSTPSSALNASPKLTSTKPISSPSFGPQFHLNNATSASSYSTKAPSDTYLPPLQHVAAVGKPSLPHFQNIAGGSSNDQNSQSNNSSNNTPNPAGLGSGAGGSGAGGSGTGGSGTGGFGAGGSGAGDAGSAQDEVQQITSLKTRISELELVNDLYRTRIMELEAMEQAARLRETSIRRRLDEIINLQKESEANKRMKVE